MHTTLIIGNVGSDPKPLGQNGCHFSIADERYNSSTKERETQWSRCVAFGKTAETILKYVTKGRRVAVRCQYQTREYTDANGAKQVDHSFVVWELELQPDGRGQQQQQQQAGAAPLW